MNEKSIIRQKGILSSALLSVIIMLVLAGLQCKRAMTSSNATIYSGKAGTKAGQEYVNPKDHNIIVWVQSGEFIMGSSDNDKDANADEKPQHTVYLDGYYIYKTDVTVGEYKAFCAATGMAMPEMPRWGWIDSHPMVNVSWGEACAYAKWAGAHLPSEAQWEKAARGTDGRKYSWGMHWDAKKCNNSSNHLYSTSAVGKYAKDVSPYGCLDMAGNVMQWCDDWYGENFYKISPTRNPKGPESGERRSLRGGSWDDKIPDDFRCASRSFNDSVKHQPERCDNIGFRCVVDPSQ